MPRSRDGAENDGAGCGSFGSTTTKHGRLTNASSIDIITGRQAIEAFWQGAIETGIKQITLGRLHVEGDGHTAYEVGRFRSLTFPAILSMLDQDVSPVLGAIDNDYFQ
jgi:hypothetical protein